MGQNVVFAYGQLPFSHKMQRIWACVMDFYTVGEVAGINAAKLITSIYLQAGIFWSSKPGPFVPQTNALPTEL